MKLFLPILIVLCAFRFPCNETVYAWEKQTAQDERFMNFPKVKGRKNGPAYPGGDKAIDKLLKEKLVLTEEAVDYDFVLNYYVVVNCDGTVGDVTVMGDPVVKEWTNIRNLLKHTEGWKAATIENKPVNCVYVRTFAIKGSDYRQKLLK